MSNTQSLSAYLIPMAAGNLYFVNPGCERQRPFRRSSYEIQLTTYICKPHACVVHNILHTCTYMDIYNYIAEEKFGGELNLVNWQWPFEN